MKIMSVFGTRPEMIKMWGVLKKLDSLNFEHTMVHTGQNFTYELRDFFFNDLQLRNPDYQLEINTEKYATEIADIIIKDLRKSIYYYCYLIEKIINDKSIEKQLLMKILERFKTKEKKNIKILKDKLIEEINKR